MTPSSQTTPVRALPGNTRGRDFILGDLHGCTPLLEALLEHVSFDTACDRLFSVGDLVDRGPDTWGALQLLHQPWFHAVQGNHEHMLVDAFSDYRQSGKLASFSDIEDSPLWYNGGTWVAGHYLPEQHAMQTGFNEMLDRVAALPLILVVGSGKDRFNVFHAELLKPVKFWQWRSSPEVWLDADLDAWLAGSPLPSRLAEQIIWSRTLMQDVASKHLPLVQDGLSPSFCGHTINTGVRRALSHICLDTGAFLTFTEAAGNQHPWGLTLYSVQDHRHYQASWNEQGIHVRPGKPPAASESAQTSRNQL